jgi:hypothetical protein
MGKSYDNNRPIYSFLNEAYPLNHETRKKVSIQYMEILYCQIIKLTDSLDYFFEPETIGESECLYGIILQAKTKYIRSLRPTAKYYS